MTILIGLVLTVVLLVVATSVVIFIIGPGMLLQPHRRTVSFYEGRTSLLHPKDLGIPYEELVLKTAEGLNLSCWLIPASNAKGTIVYLHGVSECKIVGLPLAQFLHKRGYNVFLYDSRRHGDSEGRFCTYGFYEKHDTTTVITYLQQRSDLSIGKIGLFGVSMGAAVSLQVAAGDKRVSCVVAESGFASLRTIFDDYQKRVIKLPWHYLRNVVILRSERLAHFKAKAVSPLDTVKNVSVPLLFLHGTRDRLIKSSYSQLLFESANEPKELWLIEEADHSNMAETGGEEYYERIGEFFDTAMS